MRKFLPLLCGGLLAFAALPAAAADGDLCIRRNDIKDWSAPAAKQLILQNYAGHKVLLSLTSGCEGFGVYDSFQITGPVQSDSSCIVAGDRVTTVYAGERGVCSVRAIETFDGSLPPKHSR